MRVALLSYRSKPHCGGQGVYVRHLSRELVALGHEVEVFSGQPYPDLDDGVRLTKVPSLDLYREPDPFRMPRLREFRDLVDVEEFLTMCTAGFPEPKTFSTRVARLLRERPDDFDVVHDNQVLGYGILDIGEAGPAGGHHDPPPDHRRPPHRPRGGPDLAQAADAAALVRLPADAGQGRPRSSARADPLGVVRRDIVADFGVDPDRMRVIPLGVDDVFRPPTSSAGAGPHRGDGQRRRADEGHRDAARGLRQAAHRARRPGAPARDASRSRAAGPSSSSTGSPSPSTCASCTASATPSWSR